MKRFAVIFTFCFCSFSLFGVTPIQQELTPVVRYLDPVNVYTMDSGLRSIDCIYVINLNSRPDKWERTSKLFAENDLRINRVQATDGWRLDHEVMEELSGPYPVRLQAREYGRLLSYLRAMKDAFERGFECIWICEDTVEFFDDVQKISSLIDQLSAFDPNWHVFYPDVGPRYQEGERVFRQLSVPYDPRPDEELESEEYYAKKFRVSDDIMKIRGRAPFNSLLISKRGIQKILHYFAHVFLWSPIDVNLHTIPNMRQYAVKTDIVSRWVDGNKPHKSSFEFSPEEGTEVFKRAQELLATDQLEGALEVYEERISMQGDQEEVFWSLYQVGLIQQQLNIDPEVFLDTFNRAYLYAPSRAEPLYRLTCHYRAHDENNLAYILSNYALALEEPESNYKEKWIYEWGLPLEYSLAAYYSGRPLEFKVACEKMLANPELPQYVRECVIDNLKFVGIILPPLGSG